MGNPTHLDVVGDDTYNSYYNNSILVPMDVLFVSGIRRNIILF